MTEKEELEMYRRAQAQALANPEARELYLKLRKTLDPNAVIPEEDIPKKLRSEFQTELQKRDEEIAKYKKEQSEKEFINDYTRRKAALREAPYYLDESDLPNIEKLVEEKGFPSLEVAADYYRAVSEPLKPSALGVSGISRLKGGLEQRKEFNDRFKKIFKPRSSKYKETFDKAWSEVESGEYLNNMR